MNAALKNDLGLFFGANKWLDNDPPRAADNTKDAELRAKQGFASATQAFQSSEARLADSTRHLVTVGQSVDLLHQRLTTESEGTIDYKTHP